MSLKPDSRWIEIEIDVGGLNQMITINLPDTADYAHVSVAAYEERCEVTGRVAVADLTYRSTLRGFEVA